jgi:hypothetical protein
MKSVAQAALRSTKTNEMVDPWTFAVCKMDHVASAKIDLECTSLTRTPSGESSNMRGRGGRFQSHMWVAGANASSPQARNQLGHCVRKSKR